MMKKIYLKPKTEVFNMKAVNMICSSPGIKGGKATPGGGSLAPEIDDFIDDENIDFTNWKW